MKKLLVVLVLFVLCISAVVFFGGNKKETKTEIEKAAFDTVAEVNDFELTVDSNIVTSEELNGDEDQFEEFLTTDMTNYGDSVLCDATLVAHEGHTMVVVSYSIKNNAQANEIFDEKVILNYNDGYEYEASGKYYSFGDIDYWHEYSSLSINPLTTVMCKTYFTVPEEVVNNTDASLSFIISNQEYPIR